MEGLIVLFIALFIFLAMFWDYFSLGRRAKRAAARQRQHPAPLRRPQPERSNTPNPSEHAVSDKVRMAERSLYGSSSRGIDDLATFSLQGRGIKSHNKKAGEWIKRSDTVRIQGEDITGGFFYFGGRLPATNGMGTEASLVDESLPVEKANHRQHGDDLGYWPHYNSIPNRCRGAYLSWLASDRSDPKSPIGYVFLYFYGLERRITIDSEIKDTVSDEDFASIGNELRRLIDIYGYSHSFRGYSAKLLEWMKILRPKQVKLTVEEMASFQITEFFSLYLGRMVKSGKPLSPKAALTWLYLSDYLPRTPAQRCKQEFDQLFMIEYSAKYGEGMVIKPNKKALVLNYYSASPTIGSVKKEGLELPNPMNLPSIPSKLQEIANRCTDKLDRYSRYLGKEGTNPTDVKAIALLPDELCQAGKVPALDAFRNWAQERIAEDAGVIGFEDLWAQVDDQVPEKLTKKDLDSLLNLLDKSGVGMAPDPRHHHAKPGPGAVVALFEQPVGGDFTPSKRFNDLAMALRLGSMVANIDGHVHEEEVAVLRELIGATDLPEPEKRSARAYLTWRLRATQDTAKLKAQIEQSSDKAKKEISHLLISVALADGKISPSEIKELEKLYTRLGLDKALLSSDIHTLSASGSSAAPASKGSGFELNERLLAQRESETQDAQGILGAIFAESDEPEPETGATDEDVVEEGLDAAHSHLYHRLITQTQWPYAEVEALCKDLGLMIEGALETINDWAFEQVDEPVIETDSDPIEVDLEIANEIANQ